MLSHGAVASHFLGEDVVYEAFADWTTARVRPEVKAALGMLAKLTHQPLEFGPADVHPLLELGVSPAGIEQAIGVGGYIFNYQNRMADALGADIPADKVKRAGRMLNLSGRAMLQDRKSEGAIGAYDGEIPPAVVEMVASVISGPGDTNLKLRKNAFNRVMTVLGFPSTGTDLPAELAMYVDTVGRYAPDITDDDVHELLSVGWSEEEIFEITVAASVAAGYGRLKIAWQALSQGKNSK
jgi:alkylhydroperoxidase family enzyme